MIIKLDMESMYSNSIQELVDNPNGIRPIGYEWLYKRKIGVDGKVDTFKDRLRVKGFIKKEGLSMRKPSHQQECTNSFEYSYPLQQLSIMRFGIKTSRQHIKWLSCGDHIFGIIRGVHSERSREKSLQA